MTTNNENLSIKLGNGKVFYITPKGAKISSGGRVKPLPEMFYSAVTSKSDRRKVRKILRKMGRTRELMETLGD